MPPNVSMMLFSETIRKLKKFFQLSDCFREHNHRNLYFKVSQKFSVYAFRKCSGKRKAMYHEQLMSSTRSGM